MQLTIYLCRGVPLVIIFVYEFFTSSELLILFLGWHERDTSRKTMLDWVNQVVFFSRSMYILQFMHACCLCVLSGCCVITCTWVQVFGIILYGLALIVYVNLVLPLFHNMSHDYYCFTVIEVTLWLLILWKYALW